MNSKLKQPYDYLNCYIYICIESASESLFGTYYDEHGGLFGVNVVIFFLCSSRQRASPVASVHAGNIIKVWCTHIQ